MYCPDCGMDLDDTPVGDPCPVCRGLHRSAVASPDVIAATSALPNPRLITGSNLPDGSKKTVVGSVDFQSTTTTSPSGELLHEYRGESVRGEGDVPQVCEILQEALRRRGVVLRGKFRTPSSREEGIDAEAETVDGVPIRVQVTGVVGQATMAKLGRDHHSLSEHSTRQLAEEICDAIERKAARYPAGLQKEVVLALDAIRSPGHASSGVVHELKSRSCEEVLGSSVFQAIWLVGPTAGFAHRLDE